MKFKLEKYEIKMEDWKDWIDIDTLDGWVTFLVNLLEEYRKWLEEDVWMEKEREDQGGVDDSLIDYEDEEVCK